MTQEEKQLLLVDLCARLPYGVQYKDAHGYKKTIDIWSPEFHTALNTILYDGKPSLYLRPMSSMTEEEKIELCIISYAPDEMKTIDEKLYVIQINAENATDFYNRHYFDYRGLIEKGLVLVAPEGMYNLKEK